MSFLKIFLPFFLGCVLVYLLALGAKQAPSPDPGGFVQVSYTGGGCPAVFTLDGGQAVTETATEGDFILWRGLAGIHQVRVQANGQMRDCLINVWGLVVVPITGLCSSLKLLNP